MFSGVQSLVKLPETYRVTKRFHSFESTTILSHGKDTYANSIDMRLGSLSFCQHFDLAM